MAAVTERDVTRTAAVEYGVPSALIAASALPSIWLPDLLQLLIPAVALVCGLVLRPRRVWVVWLAATVAFVLVVLIWVLLGNDLPKATEPVTPSGVLTGAWVYLPYFAATALLPLWLGRWLRRRLDRVRTIGPASAA